MTQENLINYYMILKMRVLDKKKVISALTKYKN